jgi:hypothetical protein
MSQRYETVNATWPVVVPELTKQEVVAAVKRMWRRELKQPFPGTFKFVTGVRRTRLRMTEKGWVYSIRLHPLGPAWPAWKLLIHSLSHQVCYRKFPSHQPHDARGTHAFIEREMIGHVLAHGWLDGKLRRPELSKPAPDRRQVRHQRVLRRIEA